MIMIVALPEMFYGEGGKEYTGTKWGYIKD
jgi:hypothetical protein